MLHDTGLPKAWGISQSRNLIIKSLVFGGYWIGGNPCLHKFTWRISYTIHIMIILCIYIYITYHIIYIYIHIYISILHIIYVDIYIYVCILYIYIYIYIYSLQVSSISWYSSQKQPSHFDRFMFRDPEAWTPVASVAGKKQRETISVLASLVGQFFKVPSYISRGLIFFRRGTHLKDHINFLAPISVPQSIWLVVWTPLKNMKVNWDDYSQDMGK